MTWAHALRRPRISQERTGDELATANDAWLLRRLLEAEPAFTPMWSLGGYVGSQTVYRLRNTHGADIITTITGKGYRLSRRGIEVARSLMEGG
jgi:hypothetical protein